MKKEKSDLPSGIMTSEEYYSRHENDGTAEIAAFCFAVAVLILVLAAIFG